MPDHIYQVALSFAGEQRDYVRAVAAELERQNVAYFYDEEHDAELWGRDLNEALQEIYRDKARFVVMFVSVEYAQKSWPTRERRAAFEQAVRSIDDVKILPVRFDSTGLPGLSSSVSYIPASSKTPEELAHLICRKLVLAGESIRPRPSRSAPKIRPANTRSIEVAVRDDNGKPLEGVMVVLASKQGRYWQTTTTADGNARLTMAERTQVTILASLVNHSAGLVADHDSGLDVEVIMPSSDGWSSGVILQTGRLEGFPHRINPIADSHAADGTPGRMYIYVDDASVNDLPAQPCRFELDEPLTLDDGLGNRIEAHCLAFVGRCSLWEYTQRTSAVPDQST